MIPEHLQNANSTPKDVWNNEGSAPGLGIPIANGCALTGCGRGACGIPLGCKTILVPNCFQGVALGYLAGTFSADCT